MGHIVNFYWEVQVQMNDDKIVSDAVAKLASIFGEEENTKIPIFNQGDALLATCIQVGQETGINVIKPLNMPTEGPAFKMLQLIANTSRFRIRKVALTGTWWETDNGPLLVFDNSSTPLALIMHKPGQYELVNPNTGHANPLTHELIKSLAIEAYSFYRTLPDTILNLPTLLRFAMQGQKRDILRTLALQSLIGLIGLFVPIATGIILDDAVPNANLNTLVQFIIGLIAATFAMSAFSLAQNLTLLRVRFKMNAATQAAVWDRLLRLPVDFFYKFSPGDLTVRAAGVDTIQQELTDATLQTLLSGIFSILTLALMFYYSVILALGAVVLLILLLALLVVSSMIQLKFQRPIANLQGKLAGLSFQFLTSISKLRVSNSESRVFALWAEQFAQKNRLFFQAGIWAIRFSIVRIIFSVLTLVWLYAMVGSKVIPISFGSFIAFNAAFGQFFMATISMIGVVTTLINLIPTYERVKPILTTLPELEKGGLEPGSLTGHITINQVNFRYQPHTPLVLEHINITINPGEFVALVGATGSGKSTLFRLLLGFETPATGSILYDDQNLSRLNIRSVREQIGAVLQNDTLIAGTIFENIAASQQLTLEDAWSAVNQVNLKEDIEAMPMGLHTIITEGGKTLSVGQRQRVMIARALVRNPRILLLDEATSALDNPTQAEVMRNLEQLKVTRIVAAHRLSTLIHADRIYVLKTGKVVESGTYDSLLAEDGVFAELVKRQLLSPIS